MKPFFPTAFISFVSLGIGVSAQDVPSAASTVIEAQDIPLDIATVDDAKHVQSSL
ncbi:MAG: hypothetical protein ABSF80_02005 [Chitinispirillaceae bacterium]|jgi:hypothetical protein